MEELRAQHVYVVLAFPPPMVASSSHFGGDEKWPNSIVGTKVRSMVNAPSSQ